MSLEEYWQKIVVTHVEGRHKRGTNDNNCLVSE